MNKIEFHEKKIIHFSNEITQLQKKIKHIFIYRLSSFLLAVTFLIYLGTEQPLISVLVFVILIAIFFTLARKEDTFNEKIIFCKNHQEINSHEINLLQYNFKNIDDGSRFQKDYHEYAKDLDIFGIKSIYQLLNRTNPSFGSKILADALNSPPLDRKEITDRQNAVQELSLKEEWCYDFIAHCKGSSQEENTKKIIVDWLNSKSLFNLRIIQLLRLLLPASCITAGILGATGIIGFGLFWLIVFIQVLFTIIYSFKINDIHAKLSKKYALIDKYLSVIQHTEQEDFKTPLLTKLRAQLSQPNLPSATQVLAQLNGYLDLLDARLNIIMAIVLNGLFLWDINTAYKIERWRIANQIAFQNWMNAIGQFDAMISLALFANSNPEYTYPEILEGEFKFVGEDLGHPLVDKTVLVKNPYHIEGTSKVDLLTGANMAGKSTFLRTVGVNIVLSRIGAPVCGSKLMLTPIQLFTSLRTIDSLQENESFFYAELKRLETLIKLYQNQQQIFFLLDEILKGTNSEDQHFGSIGLIKKILSLNGCGIIATHDLALATLQKDYPTSVRNLCFEIEIDENALKFDYKLREGFCSTMNASFLMKKMNII